MKKFAVILSIIVGLAITASGVSTFLTANEYANGKSGMSFSVDATYHDVKSAIFGADFYTYMYDASDTMVDELNEAIFGIRTVVNAQNALYEATVYNICATMKVGSMLMVALGMALVIFGMMNFGVAFPAKKKDAVTGVDYLVELDAAKVETQILEGDELPEI